MEMTLENILCGIEQQVANEIVFMERRLEKLQHSPALLGARDKESIKSFFGKEDRECLNRLLYIHKEDKDIKEGLKIEEGWGGTSPLVSFHGQIAQETFKKSGFKIPEKLFPIKITPEVQAFKENVEGLHKMDPLKKLGKLSPLHLGPDSSFLFATFIKNASDSLSAYIQLGFNYRKAVNNFLAKAQREIKIGRVILRPIRRDSPVGLRRAHNEIEKLLDIAQYTGERIVNQIRHKNQNFISLSRPLRGLGIPALALLPEKEFESPVFLIKGLLTIVVLFAALSAIFGITLMRRFLLKPMLEITKTVSLVDHGDYQIRAPTTALDELGEISHSLNLMLDGLRQKSRMTFFLRRELVVKAPQNNHNQVTKKFVVVTFAGLRNFSRLESLLSPEEAFSIMSQFLVICETSVKKFRGDIDKFVGDTAMAVFQIDPFKSCEKRAIMSAIELSEEVKTWMRKRREKGLPVIQHGIGIAAGVVLAGGVGSFRKRLDFTVIGDPVNLAARLEKIAGTNLNPEILATENFSGIKIPGIRIVPTEIHSIRGKRKPMSVFGVRRG
ncbi:HAMP domain-containing protein [bacterium]|nr:HAMP domain-containing protein [bacterium]